MVTAAAAASTAEAAGAFAALRRRLVTLDDGISCDGVDAAPRCALGLPSFFSLRGLLAFSCRLISCSVHVRCLPST